MNHYMYLTEYQRPIETNEDYYEVLYVRGGFILAICWLNVN